MMDPRMAAHFCHSSPRNDLTRLAADCALAVAFW